MVPDGGCLCKPALKLKDHHLGHDYLVRDRIQFLPLREKGLILESTMGIQSLVRELRSHKLYGTTKQNKTKQKKPIVVNTLRNTVLGYFHSQF